MRNAMEHAQAARVQMELAERLRRRLPGLPPAARLCAAAAADHVPGAALLLTLAERRRLCNALWGENPAGYYRARNAADCRKPAPDPPPLPWPPRYAPPRFPARVAAPDARSRPAQHESWSQIVWTWLDRADDRPPSPAEIAVAAAVPRWRELAAPDDGWSPDARLAIAALRAARREDRRPAPAPGRELFSWSAAPSHRPPRLAPPGHAAAPAAGCGRRAARQLALEIISRECDAPYPPLRYAARLTRLALARAGQLPVPETGYGRRYLNQMLNMAAAHDVPAAAAGELLYCAAGGMLPLLAPGNAARRRRWLARPAAPAALAPPCRDLQAAIVRDYHGRTFLERCRIYFHCWLRALLDQRLPRRSARVWSSRSFLPWELIVHAPGQWPGPYRDESEEYAAMRLSLPGLAAQCLEQAAGYATAD